MLSKESHKFVRGKVNPKPYSAKKAKRQVYYARSRAKMAGCVSTLTLEEWVNALHASGGICFYCKRNVGQGMLTPDHVIPLAKGGENSIGNIVVCCLECNHSKSWVHEIPLYLQLGLAEPDPQRRYYHHAISHSNIVTRYALRYLREFHGMANVSKVVNEAIILYAREKMKGDSNK